MTTMAQAEANRAALARGEWVSGEPRQARAQVSVKAPGGVPVRVTRLVYRASLFRRDPATGRPVEERCPHYHLKAGPAAECGRLRAGRLNREAAAQAASAEAQGHAPGAAVTAAGPSA